MGKRVVIIGGSVGGLGAALGLADRGFDVTVIERDPGPDTNDGDEAFQIWERKGVPQFRQPHAFSARSRNLLLEHAPAVVDRLHDDGIDSTNLFKLLCPPELWREEDEAFTGLTTRRPAFELALRRTAEAHPQVTMRSPASVEGLLFAPPVAGEPPRVSGVRLDDGSELRADVVLDCGGRRTPVPKWLAAEGVEVPADVQDCDVVYFTRYYRLTPESKLPMAAIFAVRAELEGGLMAIGFPGDKGTFAILLATPPDDEELRGLRHTPVWEAVARALPTVAPWIDPANATPLHDVQVMAGHKNVRRRYVVDGEPLVLGLLPVGDSLCTTNPAYGWGSSMALTYAFAAVEAIADHVDDMRKLALAYDAAVADEADGVYRESAAMDRARLYRVRGEAIPDWDEDEMERQDLIWRGVGRAARKDPVLGRAFLRRINLLDRPDAVLDDPEVLERARAARDAADAADALASGPTRAEVLTAIVAAGLSSVAHGGC